MSAEKNIEYRPYRIATYTSYLVIVIFLASLPFISVFRSLSASAETESGKKQSTVYSAPGESITRQEAKNCLEGLEEIHREVQEKYANLPLLAAQKGEDALKVWNKSLSTLDSARTKLIRECRIYKSYGGIYAQILKNASENLEKAISAYNNHANLMLKEDGALFEEVAEAFKSATSRLDNDDSINP